MDDVTFGRSGCDAETWRLHHAATAMSSVAIPGRSLMSVNGLLFDIFCCASFSSKLARHLLTAVHHKMLLLLVSIIVSN